ncbi:MAG TPA: precorrin-4 C(11)-methyltransferase [Methanothrix sp.]|jgi:precorrin-4/cobalt-precorrin-4 C11-methyltransferase|nr:MAG: Uroporphyrinogen-III C-methyltransferase [Methanosaeta sp. PtaU1.Bin055]HNT72718.1 precorrin-4 C(11)-methyltransferase [Methanothrix sp.]HOI69171.1 precorrin-4 C(11)-methyltransferase [Methanothrix sp.]HPY71859.1 precorrin-4 C(11)-methyltransferase [Methanothrix sp.]HQA61753.1 precorrin-4 C(11)-methyltransferase [Methanothrix sp.]
MRVHFVGAGPGDPDLITVRGARLLAEADLVVYAGSLVNPALLEGLSAELVDSNKINLEEINDLLLSALRRGERVVRLHSGDPSLYGAILEQMRPLEEAGVEVEVVPGVSSLFAVAAALKTQLTLKGVSESLIVTRPAGATLVRDSIREFSRFGTTMAIFLGADKIRETMERLEVPKETPAAVVYHASWPDEQVIVGTVGDVADLAEEAGITKSALILVGDVISRSGFGRSHLYRSR